MPNLFVFKVPEDLIAMMPAVKYIIGVTSVLDLWNPIREMYSDKAQHLPVYTAQYVIVSQWWVHST